jgi:glycosyltransferase involved in cell wall biosynthesis
VAAGIVVDSPLVPPFQHRRVVRRASSAVLERRVRRRLRWRDPSRPLVVLTYLPMPVIRDVTRAIHADLLVYDWADEASTHMIDARDSHRRRVARWEDEMRAAADLVFVPSAELLRRRCADRPDAILLPHGSPIVEATPDNGHRPAPSGRTTIGFVGSITEFTDLDLVRELALRRPEWSFVMVGPARVPLTKLRDAPNITFTGGVAYEQIDGYLASFDAGIIPYRVTPAIEVSSPLKVHEYLAHGLPVVSVDIPEVRNLAPDVELAHGHAEFLAALDRAVARGKRPAPSSPSWSDRVDEMIDRIQAALGPGAADA